MLVLNQVFEDATLGYRKQLSNVNGDACFGKIWVVLIRINECY